MSADIDSLQSAKLDLYESHLHFAWVKWTGGETIEVLSKSSGFPFFKKASTYQLKDVVHNLDAERVLDHYQQLENKISKIPFSVYRKDEDNLRIICSSKKHNDDILSLWMLLPDEGKSLGLLAIAAHDMRSPISSIIGMINLIQMMIADGEISNEELSTMMDMIKTNGTKALHLTDEIMELAEMESDGYVLSTKPVIMKEYLEGYINGLSPIAPNKNIKVELKISTEAVCNLNEAKISRVLDNLLSNAAKFSYPDSVIEIIGEQIGPTRLLLMVRDHGVGMPQEMIDEIFVRFGKAQRKGLEGEDSHGLGMSIVKQIMDLHSGDIKVTSVEGKGTTMNLLFPIVEN